MIIKTAVPKKNNPGRIYVLFYSFVLIPFMITIVGVLFFFVIRFITFESNTPVDYLNDVKIGSATKRWQSAYELSRLLANPDLVPETDRFRNKMVSVYRHSIHDDPLVRTYLALAMGRTEDEFYGSVLLEGLKDEDQTSRIATIQALGWIKFYQAIKQLKEFLKRDHSQEERLAAVIALGTIGDTSVIPDLQGLLEDEEANIRWDAAVALAKLGDRSGIDIIENLLDRSYFDSFAEVDDMEKIQAMLVAIHISSQIKDRRFEEKLVTLATTDENMKIRDTAIKTLARVYNRKL